MNIRENLETLGTLKIENDYEYMVRLHDDCKQYCKEKEFQFEEGDIEFLTKMDFKDCMEEWRDEFEYGITVDEPWYVETWTDFDLIESMKENGVPVTERNLDLFRDSVKDIFLDLSIRKEMLKNAAARLIGTEEKRKELEERLNKQEGNESLELYDDDYTPSATYGDYSPSCPWNAPGMSISDFI